LAGLRLVAWRVAHRVVAGGKSHGLRELLLVGLVGRPEPEQEQDRQSYCVLFKEEGGGIGGRNG
jgi:hypothetical protein